MRRAARIDSNQQAVVQALRSAGMTCCILSAVGKGVPDLLIGFRGLNFLLELKDGAKCESKQSLTADERAFHETWGGQVAVVDSPETAISEVVTRWKAVTT